MFVNEQPLPPAEWYHDKACYAEAVISAVQNLRDDPDVGRHEFAARVLAVRTSDSLAATATEYLMSGLQTCTCTRFCVHGLPPWECRPANTCDQCIKDIQNGTYEVL